MSVDAGDLTIRLPITADITRRTIYERVVARGAEIVKHEASPSLAAFHRLLTRTLGADQVEPLNGLKAEIARNRKSTAQAHFICILFRDPKAGDRIVSGIYGSVQDGVLASRFLVTVKDKRQDYRGTGLSQEIYRLFVAEASRWSVARGTAIWAYVGECVNRSEAFFNDLLGRRRLYTVDASGGTALREIHYELPHLGAWKPDGTPVGLKPPMTQHLQIAAARHAGRLPFAVLERILTAFWRAWYVRPEADFNDHAAWKRHQARVMDDTLEARILGPLRTQKELILLSRAERERAQTGV